MDPGEASALVDLIVSVVSTLSYYNDRAREEEIAKYRKENLVEMVKDDPDSVLVARIDGRLAGFCLSYYDDGLLWLSWFGVATDSRGIGIGRRLIAALEESAPKRGCHKVWCDTRVPNVQSAQVLTRAGYKQLCRLENHWYGQDFFLWEKVLSE